MLDFLKPNVPRVVVEEVKKRIDAKDPVVLLDVRTPEEYTKGRIPGSINIPVDAIEKKVLSVLTDKKQQIFVYCLSGSRSVFAVKKMQEMGYTDVYDITSGLLAWRAKQYPVEQDA
jgi:rhodanese-related sulfurtransferase